VEYVFDWDARKERVNARKHGVPFRRATTVFLDPRAVSILDEEHSKDEERWVTLGLDNVGTVLVVVHTFTQLSPAQCLVRLISARKATRKELRQYHEDTT
jgi:uncharacterized DUF497 family protein